MKRLRSRMDTGWKFLMRQNYISTKNSKRNMLKSIKPNTPEYNAVINAHQRAKELRAKGLENLTDDERLFVILDEEMTKEIDTEILKLLKNNEI